MTERCNFCQPAIERFDQQIAFDTEDDRKETLATALEAFGSCFGCGDDRLICLPLLNMWSKYGDNHA